MKKRILMKNESTHTIIVFIPDKDAYSSFPFSIMGIGKTLSDAFNFFKTEIGYGYGSSHSAGFTLANDCSFIQPENLVDEYSINDGILHIRPKYIKPPNIRTVKCSESIFNDLLSIKNEFFLDSESEDVSYNYDFKIKGNRLIRSEEPSCEHCNDFIADIASSYCKKCGRKLPLN